MLVVMLNVWSAFGVSDPRARATHLVGNMTLAEKVRLLSGAGPDETVASGYVGLVRGVPRLGIPDLRMQDGPEGFRAMDSPGTTTQWPSGLTVARAWSRSLMAEWGAAMGSEFAEKGANVAFGPGVNVARIANGGRSFEYVSGEDPFLGHQLVQPLVRGVQANGIIANVKHFIDNNQEGVPIPHEGGAAEAPPHRPKFGPGDRHSTSAEIDNRTQMELYYPPFEGAVEAGVLSVMCANNLINGEYACQSAPALRTTLKGVAGFKGWVCSDYDGTRSTVDAALGGLDIAMPGPGNWWSTFHPDYFGRMLLDSVSRGQVPLREIDDKATRIVYSMAVSGLLDRPKTGSIDANVTSPAHKDLARSLASSSATLLKNTGAMLPLDRENKKLRIGVIGGAADDAGAIFGGSGSGKVVPSFAVSILHALREFTSANGLPDVGFADGHDLQAAVALAKASDVAIIVVAQTSTEGHDRPTLVLNQTELVPLIGAAQPRTLVGVISPGPFLTNWSASAAAILDLGLPGEQEGHAFVDVVFGDVVPSGKLPHSLPNRPNEVGMSPRQYPGVGPSNESGMQPCSFTPLNASVWAPCQPTRAYYSEGLQTGYRWYDAHKVAPAFPFGHGLSYTTFEYSGIEVGRRTVSLTVRNTGDVFAYEVVQLYLKYPPAAEQPFRQLRGFERIGLRPGHNVSVSFALTDRWLSSWSTEAHSWVLARGDFGVEVGASSADIRLKSTLRVD
jgi:beta-glucosidase